MNETKVLAESSLVKKRAVFSRSALFFYPHARMLSGRSKMFFFSIASKAVNVLNCVMLVFVHYFC